MPALDLSVLVCRSPFLIIVITESEAVIFWCPKVSFGRPDASVFGPWGTILAACGHVGEGKGAAEDTPWRPE